jgi:uncharacterized membrane protein
MDEQAASPLKVPVSKARLEFLFDGIFAIAMTILVIELKVPEISDRRSAAELWQALAHDAPAFGSWLLSFLMLAIFWYRHQVLYRCLHRITKTMLVIHLWMLASAAFFPFCAALLGRSSPANRLSGLAYMVCAWLYVAGLTALGFVAGRQKAFDPRLGPAEVRKLQFRHPRGAIGLAALAVIYYFLLPRL